MLYILYYYSSVTGYVYCFEQKTAYEMRISDWSSDVCSSDLRCCRKLLFGAAVRNDQKVPVPARPYRCSKSSSGSSCKRALDDLASLPDEIGRASCRERVCQYV